MENKKKSSNKIEPENNVTNKGKQIIFYYIFRERKSETYSKS